MKRLISSLVTLVMVVCLTPVKSMAASFPTDGGAIELGAVYSVKEYGSYSATLTPTESGKLLQDGCPDLKLGGLDAEYVGYGKYGQVYSYQVEAGKTYTIANDFVMSGGRVCFQMESSIGLSVVSVLPGDGTVLSTNDRIELAFNTLFAYDHAYLSVGSTSIELNEEPETHGTNTLVLYSDDAMRALYANGTLSPNGGEDIIITIEGLQTRSGVLYNGNGTLNIGYTASPKLVDLVMSKMPTTLKSFFPADDPEAICEFVFDRDIINDGSVTFSLTCGDPEKGLYLEEIKPVIDGPTVTVNLAGVTRDLSSYCAQQGSNYVSARLGNVFSVDGIGSGSMNNPNSFPFSMLYDAVEVRDLVCEFLPASGSSLAGVDDIEIWFNNADIIEFDGVEFTYDDGNGQYRNVVILNSELDIDRSNNEVTINVPVPAEVKGHKNITVRLYNMVSLDGYQHPIYALYDQLVINLISPIRPGQAIATTGEDDFVFSINDNQGLYHYYRYDFYNAEGPDGWVYGSEITMQANGLWTAYNGNWECYSNYNPRMVITAYYTANDYWQGLGAANSYELTFVGTTAPFEYSTVRFVSIDPAPNTEVVVDEQLCFTITFDGLVNIDTMASGVALGMGAGLAQFSQVEPVYGSDEYDEGYAPAWKLYPPLWAITGNDIELAIVAHDQEGKLVEGNMGGNQYDYLQFGYFCSGSGDDMADIYVFPASGTQLQQIDSFTVMGNEAISRNYNYTGQYPCIYSRDFECVYTFTDADIAIDADIIGEDEMGNPVYDEYTRIVMTVDPAITADGMYQLVIPEQFLIIGGQFSTAYNAEYTGYYSIGGEVPTKDEVELTVSPAAGDVEALKRIDIDCVGQNIQDATINWECPSEITITDKDGDVVYTSDRFVVDTNMFDWDTWTFNGFYIEPDITANGTYTLDIPAAYLTFFYGDSYSAALTAVYTITTGGVSSIIVVQTAPQYTVYDINGVLLLQTDQAADMARLPHGIYIVNGQKVMKR